MSTYKPTVIIAGRENQLDDPDGLDVAHLANVDYLDFDLTYMDGSSEGRLQWNNTDGTLEVGMPGGNVTLQIGQEHLVRCRNETGNTINNGSTVYISGESGNKPLIALSKADDKSTAILFGITTEDIAHNDNGYVTVVGQVRSMNTNGLVEGGYVFLSATVAGGLETFPAVAPNLKARVGYCLKTHNSEGTILVDSSIVPPLTSLSDCFGTPANIGDYMAWEPSKSRFEVTATKSAFFNGTFRESFDFLLSSNGTAITGSLEQSGGGDLTMQFNSGETTLNCTPAQTINITPGTDSNPIGYMVYVPQDTNILTIATSWPIFTQHIRVAYILVPSALYVSDHAGGYINQNWNDHLSAGGDTANNQGHLEHICNRIRQKGADWYSGVSPDGASDSYFTINTGNVYWQSTEGDVFQLHPHTFTAKDTAAVDLTLVVNDPDSTYNHIQNLYTSITKDSTGNTISNNRYFNLVFWGVANKTGDGDRIMINLPSGVYTTETNGIRDTAHYDNYNFPREFDIESGTAFLICRATFKMGSNDWTWVQTEDLRGLSPNKTAGVGGVDDHGSLGGLADDDHTQYVMVDGTRDFTGNVTGNVTLNTGSVTLNTGDVTLNTGDVTLNTGNLALSSGNITLTGGGGITIDGVAVTNDHGSLDGLSDDDHTQYVLVDGTRTTEHGFLFGLTDDDHTQYALASGTRAFTGNITVQGVVNAQAYDTGNYRIDETTSRLQFINQLDSGDTNFDFMPDPAAGDGEDDVFLHIWATGGADSEYLRFGYDSDLSPQRYSLTTLAAGGGVHHPIYFVHSGSDVLTIDSNGLTLLDGHGITLNSGNIASTSGDITLTSGNINLTSGNLTLNGGDIALTDGDITFDDAFVPKMLSANKSIYLRTGGNDSNGGYSSGDAFLTPGRAITETRLWLPEDYALTVNVGEGTFNVAATLDPSHTYGGRINWSGVADAHTSLTINNIDVAASALSTGLEYIDFDVNFAGGSGAAVGQFVLVKTTSGGTNPNLVKGCHEIIAYSANVATVRCVRVAGSTTLPSGTITADTLTLVKTIFDFSAATHGILASASKHCGFWNNMVFKGNLSYTGVWLARRSVIFLDTNFGTSKWNIALNSQSSSDINADFSGHSYTFSNLVTAGLGGSILIRFAILSGGRDTPVRSLEGARLNFQGSSAICSGLVLGLHAFRGGYITAVNCNIEGCLTAGTTAFYAASGGGIDASGATDDAAVSNATEIGTGGNGAYVAY